MDTQMLEAPAGSATLPTESRRQDWPEVTETRRLAVNLTEGDIVEKSRQLIRGLRKIEELSTEKKASAARYAALIEEEEKGVEDASQIVNTGKDSKEVLCRWEFEVNDHDAEKCPIYHSGLKTLIRQDTLETVEVKPISADDRQMTLSIETADPEADRAALLALGWTVVESEDDGDAAFLAVDLDDQEVPIYADSLAEAQASHLAKISADLVTA